MAFVQSELSSLKTARNWHNRLTARQWHTSHITYCWEHWYIVNDLALSQEGAPEIHKSTRQITRWQKLLRK